MRTPSLSHCPSPYSSTRTKVVAILLALSSGCGVPVKNPFEYSLVPPDSASDAVMDASTDTIGMDTSPDNTLPDMASDISTDTTVADTNGNDVASPGDTNPSDTNDASTDDRIDTSIPADMNAPDTTPTDSGMTILDTGNDTAEPVDDIATVDTITTDTPPDTDVDARTDAPVDSGRDGEIDRAETAMETGVDAVVMDTSDVSSVDSSMDAARDGGIDAPIDATLDIPTDDGATMPPDSGMIPVGTTTTMFTRISTGLHSCSGVTIEGLPGCMPTNTTCEYTYPRGAATGSSCIRIVAARVTLSDELPRCVYYITTLRGSGLDTFSGPSTTDSDGGLCYMPDTRAYSSGTYPVEIRIVCSTTGGTAFPQLCRGPSIIMRAI